MEETIVCCHKFTLVLVFTLILSNWVQVLGCTASPQKGPSYAMLCSICSAMSSICCQMRALPKAQLWLMTEQWTVQSKASAWTRRRGISSTLDE